MVWIKQALLLSPRRHFHGRRRAQWMHIIALDICRCLQSECRVKERSKKKEVRRKNPEEFGPSGSSFLTVKLLLYLFTSHFWQLNYLPIPSSFLISTSLFIALFDPAVLHIHQRYRQRVRV